MSVSSLCVENDKKKSQNFIDGVVFAYAWTAVAISPLSLLVCPEL
jgi:hypothetical protein